ncbi:MAG: TolC family protein [Candidatus Poribacteria bacterium]|nr:TolC family protein [Candidatus Poribacteria bacterium]
MRTKLTFNSIFMMGIICLLALSVWQMPSAFSNEVFSNEEGQVSLEVATQTAMRDNPELNVIREKLKVARARIEGIALLDNPKLETEFAGGIDSNQGLELTQSFQLGGQRGHQRRIAKIHLEKVNAELAEASRLLTKLVKIAFYELAIVQEKLKLVKEVIQHSEQIADIAQFRFETGDISVTQANLANIQLQSALREAVKLEGKSQLIQLELNALMGTPLETARIAVGGLSDFSTASFGNPQTTPDASSKLRLDALKTHALKRRNDLKSVQLNAELTDNELRLAKAANIPDLSVGALAQRGGSEKALGVKFTIPLPFFDRNRDEINAAKAQQQVDAIEISSQKRQISREVMAAFLSLKTAEKTLKFYEGDSVKLLNENLKLTRTAYELGEAKLLEVILMQNEFVEIRFDYLNALAAYYKALAQLEATIDTPISGQPSAVSHHPQ